MRKDWSCIIYWVLSVLPPSCCGECLRQIRQEDNSQGVRQTGKWQRLLEERTQSPEYRKELENLGEPSVSILLSGSEHGTTQLLPKYAMLIQEWQDLLAGLLSELHIFSAV